MSLSIGIVGLPNVGKSTLFNALTKKSVDASNYPFCTIDPSVGVVPVPDERLWRLSEFSKSEKTIPAVVEFVDIAGLVKGASQGEGLGNKFLSNIREVHAVAHIVRIFDDGDVAHVAGDVDPLSDIETINIELILADLSTVEKRKNSLMRDTKRGDKQALFENNVLEKVEALLKQEKPALLSDLSKEEQSVLKGLHLLTAKPTLYVLNKKTGGYNLNENEDERFDRLLKYLEAGSAKWIIVDAGIEEELKEIDGMEKEVFKKELGLREGEDGIDDLIRKGYELLDLITYFTTGEKETRAWTIKRGSTAPVAGEAIHSDFRDKFIRAEVTEWQKLLETGSFASAREKGLLRTEGKEYIVKDGDVVEFKI